jgi:hypothetical protein
MALRTVSSLFIAALLAGATALSVPRASALTIETPGDNGSPKYKLLDPGDPDSTKRLKDERSSDRSNTDDQDGPHGVTFGSQGSGLSFSVGPTRQDPFGNDRFFRGPPSRW